MYITCSGFDILFILIILYFHIFDIWCKFYTVVGRPMLYYIPMSTFTFIITFTFVITFTFIITFIIALRRSVVTRSYVRRHQRW